MLPNNSLVLIGRSTKDLFNLVEQIEKKGANIRSLKENWLDTTTPQGKLMFTFMAGISQFEHDLISQRTREGLEAARIRGKQGGRKPKLDAVKKKAVYELYQQKKNSVKDICGMFNISKPTLYKIIEDDVSSKFTGNV